MGRGKDRAFRYGSGTRQTAAAPTLFLTSFRGAQCEKLVELESLGVHFEANKPRQVSSLADGLIAQPGGSRDDPRFNNTQVEFRWPD